MPPALGSIFEPGSLLWLLLLLSGWVSLLGPCNCVRKWTTKLGSGSLIGLPLAASPTIGLGGILAGNV
eukprot:9662446-Prorocentrum_lima.AAC.1